MGLLFDVNTSTSSAYTYSPQLSTVYSPTDARQLSIQYTAPVFQIESPNATVTSKKDATLGITQTPTNSVTAKNEPTTSAEAKSTTDNMMLYLIIGAIAIGGIYIFKKVK